MICLFISMFMVLGIGDITKTRTILIAEARFTDRRITTQQISLHRQIYVQSLNYELKSNYSWIAPVNCINSPCLALTFDDGPNPITTPAVLRILEQQHVIASFFVVGSRVNGNQSLLQRMYRDGDEIGNHSWSHPDFTQLSARQIRQQIDLTQRAVESAGVPAPTLFRPPYGDINHFVLTNVPLAFMFWNEDPRDWAAGTPLQVEQAVLASVKPGGVVDMHDIYHVTANSLNDIIIKLKSKHYHFVTVSQLLGIKPGQKGEYYGRK
jgi:peptidoglycan-N-acetylglucosamine deacetylase